MGFPFVEKSRSSVHPHFLQTSTPIWASVSYQRPWWSQTGPGLAMRRRHQGILLLCLQHNWSSSKPSPRLVSLPYLWVKEISRIRQGTQRDPKQAWLSTWSSDFKFSCASPRKLTSWHPRLTTCPCVWPSAAALSLQGWVGEGQHYASPCWFLEET